MILARFHALSCIVAFASLGCMRLDYEKVGDSLEGAAGEGSLVSDAVGDVGGASGGKGSSGFGTNTSATGGTGGGAGSGATGNGGTGGTATGSGGTTGSGGGGTAATGGTTGSGGTLGTGGTPGTGGSTTSGGTGGATSTDGASTSGGSGGVASTTTGTTGSGGTGSIADACAQTGTETNIFTFDSGVQGFGIVSGSATLTHTTATGQPDPGALDLLTSSNRSIIVARNEASPIDMTGRTLSVNVWIDPGASVDAWVFVQTGPNTVWSDNQFLMLPTGTWNCLTLDMDNPGNPHPQYDPSDVRAWGFRFVATGGFQAYLDSFAY